MSATNPPQRAIKLFSKGLEFHQLNALDDAARCYQNALEMHGSFFDAQHLLGVIAAQQEQFELAVALITKALNIRADEGAFSNRGLALHQLGQYQAALKDFDSAISFNPNNPQSHYNRGNALQEIKQYEAALRSYDQAIALDPSNAEIYNNRGNTLQEIKQYEAALRSYDQAIALDPSNANAHYNQGNALQEIKQYEAALRSYDQAIALNPSNAEAFNGRGDCFYELGEINQARDSYRFAIELNPNFAEARLGLAASRVPKVCSLKFDITKLRQELSRELDDLKVWAESYTAEKSYGAVGRHQLYFLAYQDENNVALLKKYGQITQHLMGSFNLIEATANSKRVIPSNSPIRIGIISSHIHQHSVWDAITKGIVEKLDPQNFEIHLFYLNHFEDEETKQAKKFSKSFAGGIDSLEDAVKQVSKHGLDVIIFPEIGMHQLTTQLANLRLAPIQIATWGHPETSGLSNIDYYISAELLEGENSSGHYSEDLIKLPNLGVYCYSYSGSVNEPNLASLGIDENRPILVCPGSPFKYQPKYDDLFVQIVKKIPECQLVFFEFSKFTTGTLIGRLKIVFDKAGLNSSNHLKVLPLLDTKNFRGLLNKADVYLDTIGFSGFNTALQALEQNLPIVTIEGKFMRGRLASGILKRIGLNSLIANTIEQYAEIVQKLVFNSDFNFQTREHIAKNKASLFMDKSPIIAFQEFITAKCKSLNSSNT